MSPKKSSLRRHRRGSSRGYGHPFGPSHEPGGLGPAVPIDRKLAQLCEQASEALSYALACSADWVLRDLLIASVTPAPDASRLLVTVYPPHDEIPSSSPSDNQAERHAALVAKLENARSYLRSEVASAVHRKRTPDLAFRVATSTPHRADPRSPDKTSDI